MWKKPCFIQSLFNLVSVSVCYNVTFFKVFADYFHVTFFQFFLSLWSRFLRYSSCTSNQNKLYGSFMMSSVHSTPTLSIRPGRYENLLFQKFNPCKHLQRIVGQPACTCLKILYHAMTKLDKQVYDRDLHWL